MPDKNPHIMGGKGFSFFLSFSPSVLFLKSCNTGKICKPWSGNSGFSQWEHSVIPAGLCRRVNTFFSQARNSLAGERVRRKREGGQEERQKKQKGERREGGGEIMTARGKEKLFLVALFPFFLVFFFLLNCSHRWPRNQLPSNTNTNTHTAVTQAN